MSQPIQLFPGAETVPVRPKAAASAGTREGFATALDRSARRSEMKRPDARPGADRKDDRPEPEAETATQEPAKPEETAAQAPAPEPVAQAPVDPVAPPLVAQPSLHDPQFMLPGLVQAAPQAAIAPVAVAAPAIVPAQLAAAPQLVAQASQLPTTDLAAATAAQSAVVEGEVAEVAPDAEAIPAESLEGEDPLAGEQKPKAPVMPVARQHVPESIQTVKATMGLTAHDGPLALRHQEAAARLAQQGPHAPDAKPVAAEVLGEVADASSPLAADVAPAQAAVETAVRPWEIHHPVQAAEAVQPQARVIEGDAPRGEALPMREVLKTPFEQAAREPGKPTELRLHLSPENLGRMHIRVVSHQGVLSAQIRVEQPATRDLMQVQMAELRQTLADQGIKIDRLEVNVGQDNRRPDQGFDLAGGWQQQPQQQSQQDAPSSQRGRALGFDDAGELAEEPVPQAADEAGSVAATVDYQA